MTGNELREIRYELGMTQAELADRLEIARNTVTRYEIGNLKITKVIELAVTCLQMLHRTSIKKNIHQKTQKTH